MVSEPNLARCLRVFGKILFFGQAMQSGGGRDESAPTRMISSLQYAVLNRVNGVEINDEIENYMREKLIEEVKSMSL